MAEATAKLHTVSWGDPDAENTALLVHGLTGRADAFRALAERLESDRLKGWRLLAADLRGRGNTGKVEGAAGIPAHASPPPARISEPRSSGSVAMASSPPLPTCQLSRGRSA